MKIKQIVLAFAAIFAFGIIHAQDSDMPRNEIKINILNTIALGSVEIGYERFLDQNQSVGFEFLINDTYNMSIGRQVKDFNTNSFQVTYNYYISDDTNNSGIIISPLLKYRFGDYQKTETTPVINMESFIIGLGAGYKWNFKDKFALGPYVNIGRNFSKAVIEEFTVIEFNAGFSLDFRF